MAVFGLILSAVLGAAEPPQAGVGQEPSDQSMIIVTGKKNAETEVRSFVRALTPLSSQGQITPIDIVMGRPGKALEAKLRREILPPQAPEKIATTATANTAVTYYTYKPE